MILKKFTTFFFGAVLACGMAVAADRSPVSQAWVKQTFSDKTWIWENGHAYFGPDGTFQAVVGQSQSGSGTWYTARGGKLCFRATWTSKSGDGPAAKCWRHAVDAGNGIWQAPVEGGLWPKWSQFDEAEQLRPGNIYVEKFEYVTGEKKTVRATRMNARSVAQVYAGKTWKWEDGHAYFAPDGAVRAVSGNDSFGEGKWSVTRTGQICIDAIWTGRTYGAVRNKRCWEHSQERNKTIWQHPVGSDGPWIRLDTEKDLLPGDVYAAQFTDVKGAVAR